MEQIRQEEIHSYNYYLYRDADKIYLHKHIIKDIEAYVSFTAHDFNKRINVSFESIESLKEALRYLPTELFIDLIDNLTKDKDNTIPLYFLAQTAFGYYITDNLKKKKTIKIRMNGDFQLGVKTTDDLVIFKYLSRNSVRSNIFEMRSIAFHKSFLKILFNTNIELDHTSLWDTFGQKLVHKIRLFYLFSDSKNDKETQNILHSLKDEKLRN